MPLLVPEAVQVLVSLLGDESHVVKRASMAALRDIAAMCHSVLISFFSAVYAQLKMRIPIRGSNFFLTAETPLWYLNVALPFLEEVVG